MGGGPARNANGKRIKLLVILAVLAVILAGGLGYYWWSRDRVSTSDAFVDGHIYPITPRVGGYVVQVLADDNQQVQAGDSLLVLDPTDYEVAVASAEAALAEAEATLKSLEQGVPLELSQTQQRVRGAKAELASLRNSLAAADGQVRAATQELERAAALKRLDVRYLLGFGLLANAYSVFYMSGFNLNIDLATAVTGRLIQGIGMPFFFVTIAHVTMAYVPNPHMNNASAIFNLLRNLGGSFGVAFVTTTLARRGQFHQSRLAEHLSQYDPSVQMWLTELKRSLAHQLGSVGDQTQRALSVIYLQLQKQAAAMAFVDVFHLQMVIFLGLVSILWIMRKPPIGKKPSPGGH